MSVSSHVTSDYVNSSDLCQFVKPATQNVSTDISVVHLDPLDLGVSGPSFKDGVVSVDDGCCAGNKLGSASDKLVLTTPKSKKGVAVSIYQSCISGNCDCTHVLGGNKTQLKPCRFGALIFHDRVPTQSELDVFDCVVDGVEIVSGDVSPYDCNNYRSILDPDAKSKMDRIVSNEIDEGILSISRVKPHCVHSLGAVGKPDGGIRPITDCSRPEGIAVNYNVEGLPLSFTYKSIDDVVDLIERDDYLSVVDIKSVYRSVSICPEHVKYQGIRWELDGKEIFLLDHRLCFGLKCGPFYFNMLSNFIYERLVDLYGIKLVNYLDDYVTISDSYDSCVVNQNLVIKILRYVGFQISWNKVTPPAKITRYLGIDVDTELMELRLPVDKITKMLDLIKQFKCRPVVSRRDIQKLAGLLAHCSTLIKGGRSYCRRLYDLEKVAGTTKSKRVKITNDAMEDLLWWERFGAQFNGRSTIKKQVYLLKPTSDASQKGFGAYMGKDWFFGEWEDQDPPQIGCGHKLPAPEIPKADHGNINVYEFYPVLEGIRRWKDSLSGYLVVIVTDNLQVYHIIRTGRSVNKTCMVCVRELFWLCASADIELVPEYIASKENVIADTLSRLQYRRVRDDIVNLLGDHNLCCKNALLQFCRS